MDSISTTQSFLDLEDSSFEQSPMYSKVLSRFSTWSTHCSETDVDEASSMDLDGEEEEEEEVTTPALSEGGESENSGSGQDTPQATPRAQGTAEDEQTQLFFPKTQLLPPTPPPQAAAVVAEEECAGTTAPLRIQRPNLKRYGKYIPQISAPFTPPEDASAFEPHVQSPSSAVEAFDIVSWKLQALTVAQPKLALTPPTPFDEHASWAGTTTPRRRGTQSPEEDGSSGDDKRWRRALYFATDKGQVDSSAGLRVLLQSMEALQS